MDLEAFRWLLSPAGQALLARAHEVYDEQGGEPRHEHEDLDAFHALPSTSGFRGKNTPAGAPWSSGFLAEVLSYV